MAEINVTQQEADALVAMEKTRVDGREWQFGGPGCCLQIPLVSVDGREQFVLDFSQASINLTKIKYQTRARVVVPLVRIDLGGAAHRNPDGEEVPCPHIHIYREGYLDKWALPLPAEAFPNVGDMWHTLDDFMRYCNVVEKPIVLRGLFS